MFKLTIRCTEHRRLLSILPVLVEAARLQEGRILTFLVFGRSKCRVRRELRRERGQATRDEEETGGFLWRGSGENACVTALAIGKSVAQFKLHCP